MTISAKASIIALVFRMIGVLFGVHNILFSLYPNRRMGI